MTGERDGGRKKCLVERDGEGRKRVREMLRERGRREKMFRERERCREEEEGTRFRRGRKIFSLRDAARKHGEDGQVY